MPEAAATPADDPNAKALAASIDNAEKRPRKKRAAPPPESDDGPGHSAAEAEWFRVPKGCPVEPLGIDGGMFLFIDANRQYRAISHKDFGGHGLTALFGDQQKWLDEAWPRKNSKGDIIGLDKEWAARSLMAACARKGVFNADNRIRGVGAWTDADGRLLWHLGDRVLVVDAEGEASFKQVGIIGDHVYPLGDPQPHPTARDKAKAAKSIEKLSNIIRTWHWKRGDLDARLQLGWIGCALMGGALRWRPAIWATGGQGTGKSTLHNAVLNAVLGGDGSVVQTADATGAGLHQALRNRTTPVVFDELEPGDRRKTDAVIALARESASGARIIRGSPDGGHKEFVVRAAFLFSSIHIPRMEPQDAMRICVLDLLALGDRREPVISERDMLDVGRDIRCRLVERWKWWPGRLQRWREVLRESGFSSRIADTWGTLLAMADHLDSPHDDVADSANDELQPWVDQLKPTLEALIASAGSDYARLLQTLLTTTVDPYARGQKWPLSTVLAIACQRRTANEDEEQGELTVHKAVDGLASLGMKAISAKVPRPDDAHEGYVDQHVMALAIASNHTEINKLLKETKWASGVYTQTLLRIPGAWSTQQRIARHKTQCAMIPLDLVLPPEGTVNDLLTQ